VVKEKKILDILKKFISFFFFRPDRRFMFILPLNFPSEVKYKYLASNLLIYIRIKKWKKSLLMMLKALDKFFFDVLKLIYLPLSILIFFTKYRFIDLNYLQIGTVAHHLSIMTKHQMLKNKKSIVFIPNTSKYSFVSEIFNKNNDIIFVNNILLNIICLPFIYTNFISCPGKDVDYLFDDKAKKIGKYEWAKTYYSLKLKNSKYFKLNNDYSDKCKNFIQDKFGNIDLSKTFILHARENNYIKTSYIRNCNIDNYEEGINFLLSKDYNVIRLVNSYDKKLSYEKKFYELNIDLIENHFVQFYLINNSKGFVCCNSGPASIGLLLETPILQVNCIDVPYAMGNNNLYIPKLIKKDKDFIKYKSLWCPDNMMQYKSEHFANKIGYNIVENSKDELREAIKEFFYLLNNENDLNYSDQDKFKENIAHISYGHSVANVSSYFFNKYKNLFN